MLFLGLVGFKMYHLQKNPAPRMRRRPAPLLVVDLSRHRHRRSTLGGFTARPSASANLFDRLHPNAIYACHGFTAPLIFVAYSFFTALAAICLLSIEHWRRRSWPCPSSHCRCSSGAEISMEGYLPYGRPIVVPRRAAAARAHGTHP